MSDTETGMHSDYDAIAETIRKLSPDNYHEFVFCHPWSFYRQRLEMVGANKYSRILDAGHGYGQWSVIMAETADEVVGVDWNESRCAISQALKDHLNADNFHILRAPLGDLEAHFPRGRFDMIFCWSVIMFASRRDVMTAFNRCLEPGGTLILGAVNTPERWAYKAEKGRRDGLDNPNFYKFCEMGVDGLNNEDGTNAFSLEESGPIAERYGFEIEHVDHDGCIDIGSDRQLLFEPDLEQTHQNIELIMRKVRDI